MLAVKNMKDFMKEDIEDDKSNNHEDIECLKYL